MDLLRIGVPQMETLESRKQDIIGANGPDNVQQYYSCAALVLSPSSW